MNESEFLPNANEAYVEEQKILNYLLNLNHEKGKSKAKFFIARGFRVEDLATIHNALVAQGTNNAIVKTTENEYGRRYQVDCNCPTPDDSNPCIRSVWEVKAEDSRPRLITAHPL